MEKLLIIILTIGGAIAFLKFLKKDENRRDKTLSPTKSKEDISPALTKPAKEISQEEKAELEKFIDLYEKFAKYKITSLLGNILMLPVNFVEQLEKKYPRPTKNIPELNTSIIYLDDEHIRKYIFEIAKKKFGINSREELLEYDYSKKSSEFAALKNLIKEKAFKEILDEIEPYVPEEERELYKKYKRGEEKFPFNF